MTLVDAYGPLVTGHDIEQAAIGHVQLWQETYLAVAEELAGFASQSVPKFRSYTTVNEFDKLPEDQIPACVVVSPGIEGDSIERDGDGLYHARWTLGVAGVASGPDAVATNKLVKLYAAVLRALFLQHPQIGPSLRVVEWSSEDYRDLPIDADRTLGAGQVILTVEAEDVLDSRAGLLAPEADPYAEPAFATVNAVETEVGKV